MAEIRHDITVVVVPRMAHVHNRGDASLMRWPLQDGFGSAWLAVQSGNSIGPMSANTSPGPGLSGWVRPPR